MMIQDIEPKAMIPSQFRKTNCP